jgi:ankyrin repeat protein
MMAGDRARARRRRQSSPVWKAAFLLVFSAGRAYAADPPLIDAIRGRDSAAVSALIKQHMDVNAAQGDGVTALHWAVHYDDLAITDLLIRAGGRVNAADDTGVTPLYVACTNRNSAIVARLVASGADPNRALLNGETVLMNCARTGNAASVRTLIAAGALVNAKENARDQTALMWAAAEAHPEAVQALLEAGADFRARSRDYTQTVTSEQTQRAGREELNYTILRGGSTALLFAARVGDVESTRLLLAAGADPNDALPTGMSALVEAAHSGQAEVATLLLNNGADPNAHAVGYTALHAAVLRGKTDLVRALLVHGANPNAVLTKGTPIRRNTTDFNLPATLIGATPFLLAAKFLEADSMRALVAGGADPRVALKDGTTAIMLAAGLGAGANSNRRDVAVLDGGKMEDEASLPASVAAAIDLGGDINAFNQAGDTALHAAASRGFDAVVQLLVERGAHINVKNKRGLTPLAVALGAGQRRGAASAPAGVSPGPVEHQSTVDLLRRLGATE